MSLFAPPKDKDYVAIFGWPVTYTLSPYFQNKAMELAGREAVYVVAPVEGSEEFLGLARELMADPRFLGANVTNPHKVAACRLVPDTLSPAARAIGALNTLYREGSVWRGDNTDHLGFSTAAGLKGLANSERSKALVLGAGGSALAVIWALKSAGFRQIHVLARREEQALAAAQVAGPAGASPGPLTPETLRAASEGAVLVANTVSDEAAGAQFGGWLAPARPGALALDLRYSPPQTGFLRAAAGAGWRGENGLGHLIEQGRRSFKLWFGVDAPEAAILREAIPAHLR